MACGETPSHASAIQNRANPKATGFAKGVRIAPKRAPNNHPWQPTLGASPGPNSLLSGEHAAVSSNLSTSKAVQEAQNKPFDNSLYSQMGHSVLIHKLCAPSHALSFPKS